jgi:hypothetical protein
MLKRLLHKVKRRLIPRDPREEFTYGDLAAYRDLVTDEYVEHLRFVVGGYLLDGNVEAFECALRQMPDGGAIVEIGSFLGLSTNIITYATRKYGRKNPFFTCDPWVFAGADKPKSGYLDTGTKAYRDWVTTSYAMNLRIFSPDIAPHSIEAFSDQFFTQWAGGARVTDTLGREARLGGPISFAYIDGDHGYEGALKDFLNVDKFLLPGGFILLDDSSDDSTYEGLRRLAREAGARPDYELVLKAPNYLFRKKGRTP